MPDLIKLVCGWCDWREIVDRNDPSPIGRRSVRGGLMCPNCVAWSEDPEAHDRYEAMSVEGLTTDECGESAAAMDAVIAQLDPEDQARLLAREIEYWLSWVGSPEILD